MDEISFSERPAFDARIVDHAIHTYCNLAVGRMEKTVAKRGINVSARRAAILRSLATPGEEHLHIFGELEMGLFNNNI